MNIIIQTVVTKQRVRSQEFLDFLEFGKAKGIGAKALELKHGRLALTVESGKVVTLEWQEAPDASVDAA